MKRSMFSFAAGILFGALLFSGAAAYATGVMAERSTNRVYVDGREVQIEAYNIAGNNYCKLRDIGRTVGFNVTWDAAEKAVRIATGEPYAEDTPAQASRVVRLPTDGSKYVGPANGAPPNRAPNMPGKCQSSLTGKHAPKWIPAC